MGDIAISNGIRANLMALQSTASLMESTQNTLSTGNRVNSALDNPANFFTASSMNTRASDLGSLMDAMSTSVNTLKAADQGLSAITDLVESAQSTARQALQSSKPDNATVQGGGASLQADSAVVISGSGLEDPNNLGANITGFNEGAVATATATSSSVAGDDVLQIDIGGESASFDTAGGAYADLDALVTAINNDADVGELVVAENDGGALKISAVNGTDDLDFTVADGGDTTSDIAIADATATAGSNDTFSVEVDGTQYDFTIGTAGGEVNTLADLVNSINNTATLQDKVTASNEDGQLKLTSQDSSDTITIGGDAAVTNSLGIAQTDFAPQNLLRQAAVSQGETLEITVGDSPTLTVTFGTDDAGGEVDTIEELETKLGELTGGTAEIDSDGNITIEAGAFGDDIVVNGTANLDNFGLEAGTTTETKSENRATMRNQFNELREQINQLANDAHFNGVNLLDGDSLEVIFNENSTSKLDIAGTTINSDTLGISEIAEDGFQNNDAVNDTLDELSSALDTLRAQASTFGSNLSTVETRQNFTNAMMNTLEQGASDLTLADTNKEGANMLALQTRQSLATSTMSIANQADQSILSFLR